MTDASVADSIESKLGDTVAVVPAPPTGAGGDREQGALADDGVLRCAAPTVQAASVAPADTGVGVAVLVLPAAAAASPAARVPADDAGGAPALYDSPLASPESATPASPGPRRGRPARPGPRAMYDYDRRPLPADHPALKPPRDGQCYWTSLPDDMVMHILQQLPYRELAAMSTLDRNTRRLADDDALWREQYGRVFSYGYASPADIEKVRDWKMVFMMRAVYGHTHPGFERKRNIAIRALIRFFLSIFLLALVPLTGVLSVVAPHRGARVVRAWQVSLRSERRQSQLTARLAIELMCFLLFDCLLFVGLPILGNWVALGTVWRFPSVLIGAWEMDKDLYDLNHLPPRVRRARLQLSDAQFGRQVSAGFRAAVLSLAQWPLLLCDVLALVWLALPVLLTVHRLPSLVRALRTVSYRQCVSSSKAFDVLFDEFKAALCLRCDWTILKNGAAGFALGVLGCLATVVLAPLVLLLPTHRTFQTWYLIRERAYGQSWFTAVVFGTVAGAGMLLLDLVLGALPLPAWVLCVVTLYRLPVVWQYITRDSRYSEGLRVMMGYVVVWQALCVLLELVLVPVLGVVILLTMHRVGDAARRLLKYRYEELFGDFQLLRVLLDEAKNAVLCSGCAMLGVVLLTVLLGTLLSPLFVLLLFSGTQHSVLLVARLRRNMSPGGWAYVTATQFVTLLFDLALVGVNIVSWFVVLGTLYRLPYVVGALWTDPERSDRCPCLPTFFVTKHALLVLLDLLAFVFLFPILLVTCVRLPSLWHALRQESYASLMDGPLGRFLLAEVKQLGCCSGWFAAVLLRFCRHFCTVVLAVIVLPLALATLLSCSAHSIMLVVRLRRAPASVLSWCFVVFMQFGNWLLETVITAGLNYVLFFLTLATLYRAPAMVFDIVLAVEQRGECSCYPVRPVFKHGLLFFADLFSVLFVFVPVLVTCHRLPSLCRRLREQTYWQLMDTTLGAPFALEFREIGYSNERTDVQQATMRVVGYQDP